MDPATEDEPEAPGKPRLDRRTITICVAIAAVAAILSAILFLSMFGSSDDDTAGADSEATLTQAKHVPDTALTRFDGSTMKLSDFRGQKLVINFFASTCVPCKKEMPALQKVHQRLGDDVTFIGIAVQDDPDAAQQLIDKTGVSYDLAQDRTGTLLRQIGGAAFLPTTAFVAGDGTVLDVELGALTEQEMTQKISDNLLAGG